MVYAPPRTLNASLVTSHREALFVVQDYLDLSTAPRVGSRSRFTVEQAPVRSKHESFVKATAGLLDSTLVVWKRAR